MFSMFKRDRAAGKSDHRCEDESTMLGVSGTSWRLSPSPFYQAPAPWRTPIHSRPYALAQMLSLSRSTVQLQRWRRKGPTKTRAWMAEKTETRVKLTLSPKVRTHNRVVSLVQFSTQVQSTPTTKPTNCRSSLIPGSPETSSVTELLGGFCCRHGTLTCTDT